MFAKPILEAIDIVKTFENQTVLHKASIKAYPGKVNILMGENGAGKSTMINIISGNLKPTSGTIYFNNQKITKNEVKYFKKIGISVIHQEIKLVDDLTVAENIFLGSEIVTAFKTIDYSKMNILAQKFLTQLNSDINPKTKVSKLTIAQKQIVEIAKGLSQQSKVLIFDEPTSAIGLKETKKLFEVINQLKQENIAIIYITHRMEEINEIGDYVTIFRDGNFITEQLIENVNKKQIIEFMVGRKVTEEFPEKIDVKPIKLLEIENLNNSILHNINFKINKGEILGFYGLVGSKRSELFKTIIGIYKKNSGFIFLKNKTKNFSSPQKAIKNKIYYLSEDRKNEGLFLDKDVSFNISISSIDLVSYFNGIMIKQNKENNQSNFFISLLKIKTFSSKTLVNNLSGGNQQKIAIAKALATNPEVIIFDEPTRGVDVGARKEIYEIMYQLKKQGKAIVVISSDLPEIINISDRLIIMNNGKIQIDTYQKLSQNEIMSYALNIKGNNHE
ncbi:sugar ABC transporter ATP-binding protein [Mycoplasmopsis cricetuli]|uniref:sugar ABC transporter ATP-binding protein n=1 Tax=Mycoplasmopsis cricetuli TaxID=171283 RepID=UPI00046E798B|nr:sugar ABC transporter ATP-binding protein [Mycoplasmopsis cricetuli]